MHVPCPLHLSSKSPCQALAAILFLYRQVLHRDEPTLFQSLDSARADKPTHLPTVLTKEEADRIIRLIPADYQCWRPG
jgi:hypothetical protein